MAFDTLTKTFSAADFSAVDVLSMWLKGSDSFTAGALKFAIGDGAAFAEVDLPALAAGVWTYVQIVLSFTGVDRTAIDRIRYTDTTSGIGLGTNTLNIDDVRKLTTAQAAKLAQCVMAAGAADGTYVELSLNGSDGFAADVTGIAIKGGRGGVTGNIVMK